MKKQLWLSLILSISLLSTGYTQQPKTPTAIEIYQSIQKLNVLGSVLYIAAHPDDENTRLLAYMSNHVKARTAYLSLTRGDGGQNLIGPEIRELLGVIRTQELLAARRVDGGEQLFSRANDFGYSKHPDETLNIWDKDQVLHDVVLAIRNFKPDIIINRFDHRTPGTTHGHHTASALLSIEAFDLANNTQAYPEMLNHVSTWQPKRLFFNTGWWFYGSKTNFEKADKSKFTQVNVGKYYPLRGLSNNEIAAKASSQHLCQGFGRLSERGNQPEYLELLKGDALKNTNSIFEGINTSWNRIKGGDAIGAILNTVESEFNFTNPAIHIPELIKAYKLLQHIENTHWKTQKTAELKHIIAMCAGLYLEASANTNWATPGAIVNLDLEVINRSATPITLMHIAIDTVTITKHMALKQNTKFTFKEALQIDQLAAPTTPYWLNQKSTLGMYKVDNLAHIGKPETPRQYHTTFHLLIDKTPIAFTIPIIQRLAKPEKGEIYRPFEVVPKASVNISEKVFIFKDNTPQNVTVNVKANADSLSGTLHLNSPKGWLFTPKQYNINLKQKGESKDLVFKVSPPETKSEGIIQPELNVGNRNYTKTLTAIDYAHIPLQSVLLPCESKVVKLDVKTYGKNIAYIEGAGDVVPQSLKQIGYNVKRLKPKAINADGLKKFDAVVIGIRAYNILDNLKFKQQLLFDFVKQGGTMIVQYNTSHRLKTEALAPYPLTLSRDRVTDENATVTFLEPEHPILNTPNKITQNDFKNWTQERGLYFPNHWDKAFTPILAMHDKGETEKEGSLLVAKYGKGYYMYTGLSFFRELPKGVSGAYRLFANMLSLGKTENNNN